jgi:HEAT repeat protein
VSKRLFGAATVIACVSLGAWWLTVHRGGSGDAADGPPVAAGENPGWLDGLYSRNPREVLAATETVTKRGAAALPAIQAALRDPRSEADRLKSALKACAILGKQAAPAVDDVAAVLPEEGLTTEAAIALSYMGRGAFAPLRNALRNDDPIVRRESLRSLGKLTERAPLDARAVTPLLLQSLKDPDGPVRAVAATYLGIIGGPPDEAVPALIAGLSDDNVEVRREAATALGAYGAEAITALPALRKASGDKNEDVAREAGRAVLKLQEK